MITAAPSAATVQRLKALLVDDNFAAYLEVLDQQSKLYTEKLLSTDARAEFNKGMVLGLRWAARIAEELVKAEEAKDARANQQRSAEAVRAQQRRSAVFASPWFGLGSRNNRI